MGHKCTRSAPTKTKRHCDSVLCEGYLLFSGKRTALLIVDTRISAVVLSIYSLTCGRKTLAQVSRGQACPAAGSTALEPPIAFAESPHESGRTAAFTPRDSSCWTS
jgi:hypothetical protein